MITNNSSNKKITCKIKFGYKNLHPIFLIVNWVYLYKKIFCSIEPIKKQYYYTYIYYFDRSSFNHNNYTSQ